MSEGKIQIVTKQTLVEHALCICSCGRHPENRDEIRPSTLEDFTVSSGYKPKQT